MVHTHISIQCAPLFSRNFLIAYDMKSGQIYLKLLFILSIVSNIGCLVHQKFLVFDFK